MVWRAAERLKHVDADTTRAGLFFRSVGRASVLLVGGKIGRIGNIDHSAVEASGCLVREGKLQLTERFLQDSQRRIELYGEKN